MNFASDRFSNELALSMGTLSLLFKNLRDYFFRALSGSQQNQAESTEISQVPLPTTSTAFPTINIPHWSGGAFITIYLFSIYYNQLTYIDI